MPQRAPGWPLWCWWPLVVIAVSAPVPGFTTHPDLGRVSWIPFTDPADKPLDVAGNVALYLPFGASFAGRRRGLPTVLQAALAAGLLSIGVEAMQVFSSVRDPSATDVTSALIGASIAAALRATRGTQAA